MLQQALDLAPTLIELHSVRARFLKHGGCPRGAAQAAVHAESLDLADRCAGCVTMRQTDGDPDYRKRSVWGSKRH